MWLYDGKFSSVAAQRGEQRDIQWMLPRVAVFDNDVDNRKVV